jgi:hypothetical protein
MSLILLKHGVSFATASLPICENSCVITFDKVIDQLLPALIIDILITAVSSKYPVEVKAILVDFEFPVIDDTKI